MQLNELLKQLKSIEPDPDYSASSRRAILESLPIMPSKSFWQIMANSFQFGSAVALTGIFLILGLGAFSTWRFLSPFKLASLDPSALRAEAQAIDIQIELAKIQYSEPTPTVEIAALMAPQTKSIAKEVAKTEAEDLGFTTPGSSTKTTSIDEALDSLME